MRRLAALFRRLCFAVSALRAEALTAKDESPSDQKRRLGRHVKGCSNRIGREEVGPKSLSISSRTRRR